MILAALLLTTPCLSVGKSPTQQIAYDIAVSRLRVGGCNLLTVRGRLTVERPKDGTPLYVWRLEADSLPPRS